MELLADRDPEEARALMDPVLSPVPQPLQTRARGFSCWHAGHVTGRG